MRLDHAVRVTVARRSAHGYPRSRPSFHATSSTAAAINRPRWGLPSGADRCRPALLAYRARSLAVSHRRRPEACFEDSMHIMPPLRPIFVIIGAATTVACAWTTDWKERDARAEFAVMVSCPEERTVSVRRPDLGAHPPQESAAPALPSEEVARDKDRSSPSGNPGPRRCPEKARWTIATSSAGGRGSSKSADVDGRRSSFATITATGGPVPRCSGSRRARAAPPRGACVAWTLASARCGQRVGEVAGRSAVGLPSLDGPPRPGRRRSCGLHEGTLLGLGARHGHVAPTPAPESAYRLAKSQRPHAALSPSAVCLARSRGPPERELRASSSVRGDLQVAGVEAVRAAVFTL